MSDQKSETSDKTLRRVLHQGITSQVKITLTEGVFLVAFALLLGASNTVIGFLAATPSISQFLQIPSIYIVEKYRTRKRINTITTIGSRLTILFMAVIPFLYDSELALVFFIGSIAIQSAFVAIGSPSWNSWLRDLVPLNKLGQFFSRRMALNAIVSVVVTFFGGILVGEWANWGLGPTIFSYSFLFFLAFLFGMVSLFITRSIPEPKMEEPEKRLSFVDQIRHPFGNINFRNLMVFSILWSFSTNLVAPFFTVYLLTRLGLDLPIATGLSALTQIVSIMFFRFWGSLSDRFTNKSVLQITAPLFLIGTLLWAFSTVAQDISLGIPLLVVIHLLTGLSAAGVNLTSANIGLKLAPRGQAPGYIATRSVVISSAASVAPIIGGILADILASHELILTFTWNNPAGQIVFNTIYLSGIDFLFLFSVLIGIYAVHRLALVEEQGEVDEKVVIDAIIAETRRNVRNLSTVDGLRHTLQLPLDGVKEALRKKKKPQFE
ncbi:MAG: MFS transporter [Candidatus Lokiarchaeota archaeon]|nr:MFS transporter [Candidatus Lokiarchaeota archaeon]